MTKPSSNLTPSSVPVAFPVSAQVLLVFACFSGFGAFYFKDWASASIVIGLLGGSCAFIYSANFRRFERWIRPLRESQYSAEEVSRFQRWITIIGWILCGVGFLLRLAPVALGAAYAARSAGACNFTYVS